LFQGSEVGLEKTPATAGKQMKEILSSTRERGNCRGLGGRQRTCEERSGTRKRKKKHFRLLGKKCLTIAERTFKSLGSFAKNFGWELRKSFHTKNP